MAEARTLGQVAYEAEAGWLEEIMPGGPVPPWERLDPEHRQVYERIAGPVAAVERERVAAEIADAIAGSVCTPGAQCGDTDCLQAQADAALARKIGGQMVIPGVPG